MSDRRRFMQQSLIVKNAVAPCLEQFQQLAKSVEADRARLAAIAAPVSTWVNSAAYASWMTPLTAPRRPARDVR